MKIMVDEMPITQDDCPFCINGICQLDKNEYSDKKCNIGHYNEYQDRWNYTPENCEFLKAYNKEENK